MSSLPRCLCGEFNLSRNRSPGLGVPHADFALATRALRESSHVTEEMVYSAPSRKKRCKTHCRRRIQSSSYSQ